MRGIAGLNRVIGFSASMGALAVASFLVMPVMMRASGPTAWAAIALGQSIGGVGSVLVGYGWSMSGPAQISGTDATGQRKQFLESLMARLWLFVPVGLVCSVISVVAAPSQYRSYAALGALFAAAVGLSSTWFFVGTVQPYALMLTETLPRILGTLAGVVLMLTGSSARAGVAGQLAGMLLAPVVSCMWVLHSLKSAGAQQTTRRGLREVLLSQRDGVMAAMSSSAASALPILVVQAVNPATMPLFAFVDKVQRQMTVALTPFVTVLQGWMPRGDRNSRARMTIWGGAVACALGTLAVFLLSPFITRFLGGGVIHTGWALNLAMGLLVGVGTYELVLTHVVLSTYSRLRFVSRVTTLTAAASIALLIPVSLAWGAVGAQYTLLAGLVTRAISEAVVGHRAVVQASSPRRAHEMMTPADRDDTDRPSPPRRAVQEI